MWQQLRAGIGQFHRKSVNRQLLPFPAVFQCLMYHRSWLCHSQFFQEVLRLSTDIKKGSVNRTGTDRCDDDTAGLKLFSERTGKAQHIGFRCRINRKIRLWTKGCCRCQIDDPASRMHVRKRRVILVKAWQFKPTMSVWIRLRCILISSTEPDLPNPAALTSIRISGVSSQSASQKAL